jgi:hypothetical protein
MHRCCVRLYSVGIGAMFFVTVGIGVTLVGQRLVCGSVTTITKNFLYNLLSRVLTFFFFLRMSVDVLGVVIIG